MNRENNFNLIRLLAALQVVAYHVATHFHTAFIGVAGRAFEVINWFPGVPIFFAVSGFLIPKSWQSDPGKPYLIKRFLRIAPAYYVALFVSMATMLALGGLTPKIMLTKSFIGWFGLQLFTIQFTVPAGLKSYGVGNPNGSLWTIPVEVGFYIAVPILFWIGKKLQDRQFDILLLVIALASFAIQYKLGEHPTGILKKGIADSSLAHIWLFILGWLIARNMEKLRPILAGKAPAWIVGYMVVALIVHKLHIGIFNQGLQAILAPVTIAIAYTAPSLARKILGDTDLSYGVYLYHLIVVNALIVLGFSGAGLPVVAAFSLTIGLAALSWFLIEKKALALKPGTKKQPLPG